MLRKETEELQKITTNIFKSDWAWLQSTYIKSGASNALRKIVRAHRKTIEKRIAEAKSHIDVEVEIEV